MKSQLTEKDPDAGKDWRQEQRGTEDKMVGWITNSMDVRLGPQRRLRTEELILSNCGAGEDS